MSEPEIWTIEIIQTETQRRKTSRGRSGRRKEHLRIVGQYQKSDICITGDPDGEEMNRVDEVFEKIMAQTF